MANQTMLHMNEGDGERSYAKNSTIQMKVMSKTLSIVKDAIKDIFHESMTSFTKLETLRIADLGCASGPNTLLFMSEIIDTIYELSNQHNNKTIEIKEKLSLPSFFELLKEKYGHEFSKKCFISGVAASFYGRLLPSKSLHFVHSSYSLHWISQVPENLDNKGHIHMQKTCNPNVFDAYKNQFYEDFSSFLTHRSHEILPMGKMILTFIGRRSPDPSDIESSCMYELLALSLLDAVSQGLIRREDVDTFNLPLYHPHKDEVKSIIQDENSFDLEILQVSECDCNPDDYDSKVEKIGTGKYLSNCMRSITESMLVSHFGDLALDYVFKRYVERANNVEIEKTNYIDLTICLRKK